MNLYIWNKAFPNPWQGGVAFALAETEDEARQLLIEDIGIAPEDAADYGILKPPDEVHPADRPFAGYFIGDG